MSNSDIEELRQEVRILTGLLEKWLDHLDHEHTGTPQTPFPRDSNHPRAMEILKNHSIAVSWAQIGRCLQRLSESLRQMAEVIAFMSHIPRRINLLALNVAIEAARWGSVGGGLGIIGGELQKTAEYATQSVIKSEEIVQQLQSQINQLIQENKTFKPKLSNPEPSSDIILRTHQSVKKFTDTFQIGRVRLVDTIIYDLGKRIALIGESASLEANNVQHYTVIVVQRYTMIVAEIKQLAERITKSFQDLQEIGCRIDRQILTMLSSMRDLE